VQTITRALDHIPGLNSRLIDAFTRDVYVYLTYPGVGARIDKVVADALGNEPCVVVAHSLGTVVAYNMLRTRAATPQYPRLVTVLSSTNSTPRPFPFSAELRRLAGISL
jgi:pimeloyl-ACP methyl ester carboxylesterase